MAASPPSSAMTSYGLLICFGKNAIFRSFFRSAAFALIGITAATDTAINAAHNAGPRINWKGLNMLVSPDVARRSDFSGVFTLVFKKAQLSRKRLRHQALFTHDTPTCNK